jgi:hypothetical protein
VRRGVAARLSAARSSGGRGRLRLPEAGAPCCEAFGTCGEGGRGPCVSGVVACRCCSTPVCGCVLCCASLSGTPTGADEELGGSSVVAGGSAPGRRCCVVVPAGGVCCVVEEGGCC